MNYGLVLNGKSGEMSICRQIASLAGLPQEIKHELCMPRAGVNNPNDSAPAVKGDPLLFPR